jgi:(2Fe-2S) ferredoxin
MPTMLQAFGERLNRVPTLLGATASLRRRSPILTGAPEPPGHVLLRRRAVAWVTDETFRRRVMAMPERYVFVCLNQRPEGHPKGSCLDRGAAEVFNALREEQGRRLLTGVKVVATGCMEGCLAGPVLLVVPDNVWYGGVTEADVPALVERHLLGGEPVEMLRIGPEDFTA